MKGHIGDQFSISAENGVCFAHELFPTNTEYCYQERHRLTWCLRLPSQHWTEINYTVIGDQWHASIEGCGSFMSTIVDSYHYLGPTSLFFMRSLWSHTDTKTICPAHLVLDDNCRLCFQSQLHCDCHRNKMLRIRAKMGNRSKNPYTQWQLPRSTLRRVNLRNDGYTRSQLFSWMLANSSVPVK